MPGVLGFPGGVMRRLMPSCLAALGVVIWSCGQGPFLSAAGESAPAEARVAVGKQAPDFTVTDTLGKTHRLSGYKGKFVVMEWINFGCPFVGKHYNSGNMQGLQKEYTKRGVVWLTIWSSAPGKQGDLPPEQVNAILKEKEAAPTAYILDPQGTVGRMYGAKTTPDMFVVDPRGVLVYSGAIDDRVSTDIEDVKGARNYLREALDAAMAGRPVKVPVTRSYGCSVKY